MCFGQCQVWLRGSFYCTLLLLGEYESVGLVVEPVPAASSTVEEVGVSVTRVNQLLNLLRTGWISTNFDCNREDGMMSCESGLRQF